MPRLASSPRVFPPADLILFVKLSRRKQLFVEGKKNLPAKPSESFACGPPFHEICIVLWKQTPSESDEGSSRKVEINIRDWGRRYNSHARGGIWLSPPYVLQVPFNILAIKYIIKSESTLEFWKRFESCKKIICLGVPTLNAFNLKQRKKTQGK